MSTMRMGIVLLAFTGAACSDTVPTVPNGDVRAVDGGTRSIQNPNVGLAYRNGGPPRDYSVYWPFHVGTDTSYVVAWNDYTRLQYVGTPGGYFFYRDTVWNVSFRAWMIPECNSSSGVHLTNVVSTNPDLDLVQTYGCWGYFPRLVRDLSIAAVCRPMGPLVIDGPTTAPYGASQELFYTAWANHPGCVNYSYTWYQYWHHQYPYGHTVCFYNPNPCVTGSGLGAFTMTATVTRAYSDYTTETRSASINFAEQIQATIYMGPATVLASAQYTYGGYAVGGKYPLTLRWYIDGNYAGSGNEPTLSFSPWGQHTLVLTGSDDWGNTGSVAMDVWAETLGGPDPGCNPACEIRGPTKAPAARPRASVVQPVTPPARKPGG